MRGVEPQRRAQVVQGAVVLPVHAVGNDGVVVHVGVGAIERQGTLEVRGGGRGISASQQERGQVAMRFAERRLTRERLAQRGFGARDVVLGQGDHAEGVQRFGTIEVAGGQPLQSGLGFTDAPERDEDQDGPAGGEHVPRDALLHRGVVRERVGEAAELLVGEAQIAAVSTRSDVVTPVARS